MKKIVLLMAAVFVLVVSKVETVHAASTIETVKNRGYVQCGVTDRVPGFSLQKTNGEWEGFYIDFCRALGAAVIGDARCQSFDQTGLILGKDGKNEVIHGRLLCWESANAVAKAH